MKAFWAPIIAPIFGSSRTVFLWGVFILAFVVRLSIVFYYGNSTSPQMYEHGEIAHNLYTGHGFTMHWPYESFDSSRRAIMAVPPEHEGAFLPPMNPYLIYGAYLIFGETPASKEILMIFYALIGALCAPMVYQAALLIGSDRHARMAATVSALFLPAAYAVVTFSGSVLYHLLGVTILYSAFRLIRNRTVGSALLFGFCCGLMTMVRSEFFFLGVLLIASATIVSWKNIRQHSKEFIAALVVFVAVVSPWTIRNYQLFDRFVPVLSHPWYEMWRGNNSHATGTTHSTDGSSVWVTRQTDSSLIRQMDAIPYDSYFEPTVDQLFKKEVFEFIFSEPGRFIILGVKKISYLLTVDFSDASATNPVNIIFMFSVIVGVSIGVVRLWKSSLIPERTIITVFIAYYFAMTLMTVMLARYQIFLFQALLPLFLLRAGTDE